MSVQMLNTLIEKKDLTVEEARLFLSAVMRGELSAAQIAAILVALRMKGETVDEIVGLVEAMRAYMVPVSADGAIDVVGTGGDNSGTFNISTAAAFVVAGAGVKVAKHGNRAASSKCGSADVLEELGVNIQLTAAEAQEVFDHVGFVFLLAPIFHPAMKHVVAVRKELKIRTVFNILGPFANPASTLRQLTGVPDAHSAAKLAKVAKRLGYKRLFIVSSSDGMDEISISARTTLFDVSGKTIKKMSIDPKRFGFKKVPKNELFGGSAEENAMYIREILEGAKGSKRDIVVFNSAFALLAAGAVKTVKEGIALAQRSIDEGRALRVLENLILQSKKFAKPV